MNSALPPLCNVCRRPVDDHDDECVFSPKRRMVGNDPKEESMREAEGLAYKASSHLPDMVDSYIAIRAERLKLAKEVETLEEGEKNLAKTIIAKMREGDMKTFGTIRGTIKLHESMEPVVEKPEDWTALYEYIKENNAWEFLHKRLTVTVVKEHWEAGEQIPGVKSIPAFKITTSKA